MYFKSSFLLIFKNIGFVSIRVPKKVIRWLRIENRKMCKSINVDTGYKTGLTDENYTDKQIWKLGIG